MSGSDSAPSSLKLRIAEAVALFATVCAVGLTALLEPATAAVESNPVAAGLLDALGWTGAGIVAVVGEVALFEGWRRLSARGYPRAALGAGAGIAAVGFADVLVNLLVLSRVGLPETARIGEYGGVTAIVAVVAGLAFFRGEVRVLAEMLVYALGDVTSGLSTASLSGARSVLLVAMLVLAAISGVVTFGPLPAADTSGATTSSFVEGFEDQDFTNNPTWDDYARLDITSQDPFNGSYAAEFSSAGSASLNGIGNSNDGRVSVAFKVGSSNSYTGSQNPISATAPNGDASVMVTIDDGSETGTPGTIMAYQGLDGYNSTGVVAEKGKYYQYIVDRIDATENTYRLTIKSASGSELASKRVGCRVSCDGGVDIVKVYAAAGDTFDGLRVAQDPASLGQKVSGTVSDSDGNAIDGATAELLDSSDSAIATTTTNATGYYKFDAISDGEYDLRASAPGYQNKTKSITVSGSPVTADLTLNEEGTYVQTFQLDDNTGAFPADETSLVLERYDPALHTFRPVTSRSLNSDAQASFRLTEGLLYRVEARNAVPNQRMAVQSWAGIQADRSLDDPYILETDGIDAGAWSDTPTATPTATPLTPTATPAPGATPTPTTTPAQRLPDPNQDSDGDGVPDWYDPDDDGDGTRDVNDPNRPSYDGYGPSYLSECTLSSGQDGAKIQYYDPTYNTTALDYSINGPGGEVYNGTKTFTAPVGYWSECVAGSLTGNVTDEPASEVGLNGTATLENGSAVPLDTDFDASSNFESFAPMGDPADSPAEQATAFGLAGLGVALSYLASRRTNVLEGLSQRSPVDPVFAGGSAASVLFGLEFSSGGQVSAAVANGAQAAAPLAGVGAVGLGGYWAYKRFIASQDVTVVAGEE